MDIAIELAGSIAMTGIRVDVQADEAGKILRELQKRMGNTEPVLDAIGQLLVSSTQLRFVDQEDPEHVPWEPLSQATLDRRRKKGVGAQILRDTGRLASSISYTVSPGSVLLGTDVKYAGIQQFGTKKGSLGKTKRGTPIPWGDIPPRPFFGYNNEDQAAVLELLQRYIDVSQPESWWKRLLSGIRRWF